ncbi:HAD family phosphatase [Sphingomonas sp. 28-62-11]|uniref:HAD family hydrolase n=1 Tax=Sphingomonas sp. 28-62-11 TaxID=1970432 RepID=UPI000BC987A8|nr:MAG: haloacid dehalogenase [Sphingomonas sp. 28-62-11]
MVRLAIYDMDKTITRAATWTPFLLHAARGYAPWRLALLPLLAGEGIAYGIGLRDRGALKERAQRLMLGDLVAAPAMAALADTFADRLMAVGVHPAALAQIAADRAAGYRLVLATASFGFYVGAIADRLGFDAVIATGSERGANGAIRAAIAGENCYGPAKLRMIEAWLASQGIARDTAHVRFYSDHASDAPTLDWADEAFAVNPHPPLRVLAVARGWPVLDWAA